MGALVSARIAAPPYGQRRGWVPRQEQDFGGHFNSLIWYTMKTVCYIWWKYVADGGAFPEIMVAQYPLGMGAPNSNKGTSNALAVQLDQSGKIKYDAIARQGHSKDKVCI